MNNSNNFSKEQEIGYRNYDPFINLLNQQILGDMLILGKEMFYTTEKMEEYFFSLRNIFSATSSYYPNKKDIEKELKIVEDFLFDETKNSCKSYRQENKEIAEGRRKEFSFKTKNNIRVCVNKLLQIFKSMNEYFSENGLTPKPEKRQKEIWEEERSKSLRERQKAICDLIMGS